MKTLDFPPPPYDIIEYIEKGENMKKEFRSILKKAGTALTLGALVFATIFTTIRADEINKSLEDKENVFQSSISEL